MLKSAVVFVLWLTSVTLTVSWPCGCDSDTVGCNVFNMANVMAKDLDTFAGNLVFSPFGLWTALLDASHTAKGKTRVKLYDILWGDIPQNCNEPLYEKYLVKHDVRNRIYYKETAPFWFHRYSYVKGDSDLKYYHSIKRYGITFRSTDFTQLDFALEPYVEKYSNDLRPNVVLTKETNFLILTITRFEDMWRTPFKRITKYKRNGRNYDVMDTSGVFYHAFDRKQGTRYIYLEFENRDLLMVLVIPDSKKPRPEASWDMLDRKDKEIGHLNVTIPLFNFEVEYSFKKTIRDMDGGMLFTKKSDFTGMNGINAPLSQLVQKTYVRVCHEGLSFQSYTILVTDPKLTPEKRRGKDSKGEKTFTFYLIYRAMVVAQGRVADPYT